MIEDADLGWSSVRRFTPVPSLRSLALNAMPRSFALQTESEQSYHRKTIEIMKFNAAIVFNEKELARLNVAYSYAPCDLWLPKRLHCYEPETYVGTLRNRNVKSERFLKRASEDYFHSWEMEQDKEHLDISLLGRDVRKISVINDCYWKCKSLEVKFEYLSEDRTFFVITCEEDQFHPSHPFYDFRRNIKSHEEYAIPKPVVKMQFKILFSDLDALTENSDTNALGIPLEMVCKGLAVPYSYRNNSTGRSTYDVKFFPREYVGWDVKGRYNPIVTDGDHDFKLRLFKDSDIEGDTVFSVRHYYYSPPKDAKNSDERVGGRGSLLRAGPGEEKDEFLFYLPFGRKRLEKWKKHVKSASNKGQFHYYDQFRLENVDPLLLRDLKGGMTSQLPSLAINLYELVEERERIEMMKCLDDMMGSGNFRGFGSFCSTFTFPGVYCSGFVEKVSEESVWLDGTPVMRMPIVDLTLIGYGSDFSNKHVELGRPDYIYFKCTENHNHKMEQRRIWLGGMDIVPTETSFEYYRYHRTNPLKRFRDMWKYRTPFPSAESMNEDDLWAMTYADPDYGVDLTVALNYEDVVAYEAYQKRSDMGGVPPEIRTEVWGAVCDCQFYEDTEPDETKWNTKYAYFNGDRTDVYLRPEIFHQHSDHLLPNERRPFLDGDVNPERWNLVMTFYYSGNISDTERVLNFQLNTSLIREWKSAHDEYQTKMSLLKKKYSRVRNSKT